MIAETCRIVALIACVIASESAAAAFQSSKFTISSSKCAPAVPFVSFQRSMNQEKLPARGASERGPRSWSRCGAGGQRGPRARRPEV